MKKHLLSISCLICFIILSSACKVNTIRGEGKKGSTARELSTFNNIEIDLPLKTDINVQEGSHPGVRIDGYENVINHIKTEVRNNRLRIYSDLDATWSLDVSGVQMQIAVPSLAALGLTGAPMANVHGNIAGKDFKASISGASRLIVDNLNVDNFSSEVSGAACIEINGGTVRRADYQVSGAAKIQAFPLQSKETSATISGAGKGEFTSLEKLDANISGAGKIVYKGHPAVSKDISGAGAIADAN